MSVPFNGRLRASAAQLRKAIASPTSSVLAYTCFCLLSLIYALCLVAMPDRIIERVAVLSRYL